MSEVSVVACETYQPDAVRQAVIAALSPLGGMGRLRTRFFSPAPAPRPASMNKRTPETTRRVAVLILAPYRSIR